MQASHHRGNTQFNKKQPQDPRLSVKDAARLILRHILTQCQRLRTENKAQDDVQRRAIPQLRNICERNVPSNNARLKGI
ncbi:hypothetical protein ALC53_12015 [Atta colombica]|uniref:Uncharacterized protein n=1 Tax=Atta colombica TaxID=520822 RepID=A0A195AZ90_9HYME|nr:hypothetical protein ALC53_12015 [Atta colombica]